MQMKTTWSRAFLLSALAMLPTASVSLAEVPSPAAADVAEASSLSALLSQIQSHYSGVDALSASFTQVTSAPTMAPMVLEGGTLQLSRPNQMRVTFPGSMGTDVVTDGQTLWVHARASGQVHVTPDLSSQGGAGGGGLTDLLSSLGSLKERFEVEERPAEPGLRAVSLRPRPGSAEQGQFKELRLELDAASTALTRLEIHDDFGTVTEMRFSDFTVNPELPADTFTFTPPEGAQVIRSDQF